MCKVIKMLFDQVLNLLGNVDKIFYLILAILIPIIIYEIVTRSLKRYYGEEVLSNSFMDILFKFARYVTLIVIFVGVLDVFNINVQSIIVSLGLVSLAVSLAAKDTLSNFISGITIYLDKRFVVGDIIEIDGHKGQVKKIGLKSVSLYHKKKYMAVPNTLFSTKPFTNYTKDGFYPVIFNIKILNEYNLDEKIGELEKILDNTDLILKEPKYLIKLENITTTGVEILIKVYIDNYLDEVKIRTELIKIIKRNITFKDLK